MNASIYPANPPHGPPLRYFLVYEVHPEVWHSIGYPGSEAPNRNARALKDKGVLAFVEVR